MINPRNLEIKNYDYNLPEERIAKYPLEQRDQSKLLVWKGEIEEHHFCDLPSQIPAGSMIVFNNTKVIQARLHFRKPTGGIVEVFCLEPESPKDYQQNFASETECTWTCLVGNSKKWKDGPLSLSVTMPDGQSVTLYCERAGSLGPSQLIHFYWKQPEGGTAVSFAQLLDAMGELPIPPYLNRATEEKDKETYQTVYSRIKGSVAAPTAGLHYTQEVLEALQQKDIRLEYLTLHVGAGTFKPVKSETIDRGYLFLRTASSGRGAVCSHWNDQCPNVGESVLHRRETFWDEGLRKRPSRGPRGASVGALRRSALH